jgi:hypothetical protein
MPVPDLWLTDLKMLQIVVELQASHNGDFPLDKLMDKVGLLDHGDSYTSLTPWIVTESLHRLAEGGFLLFLGDPAVTDGEDEDDDYREKLEHKWLKTDSHRREREIEKEIERYEQERDRQREERRQHILEAFFKGTNFEDACWRGGRFYIGGVMQVYPLRSTPSGLRRVGAWPNPEKFSEDLIAILGDLAKSIERRHPRDAKKLREVGKVVRSNAIELSAALMAKLLEHAAGLSS